MQRYEILMLMFIDADLNINKHQLMFIDVLINKQLSMMVIENVKKYHWSLHKKIHRYVITSEEKCDHERVS